MRIHTLIYESTKRGKYTEDIGGSRRGMNTFENRSDCKVIWLIIMIYFVQQLGLKIFLNVIIL